MIYYVVSLVLQAIWFFLLYKWTRAAGRKIEQMQDQIAQLAIDGVETGKQLSDLWRVVGDLETTVSDRDYRATTSTPKKPRRKK